MGYPLERQELAPREGWKPGQRESLRLSRLAGELHSNIVGRVYAGETGPPPRHPKEVLAQIREQCDAVEERLGLTAPRVRR